MLNKRQITYCKKAIAERMPFINDPHVGLDMALMMHMLNGTLYLKGAIANDILTIRDFSPRKYEDEGYVDASEVFAPKDINYCTWREWDEERYYAERIYYYHFEFRYGLLVPPSGKGTFHPQPILLKYLVDDGVFYFKDTNGSFVEINLVTMSQALKSIEEH